MVDIIFEWGSKENSQNPDAMEAETVKTKIRMESVQKWWISKYHFVSLLLTLISQA